MQGIEDCESTRRVLTACAMLAALVGGCTSSEDGRTAASSDATPVGAVRVAAAADLKFALDEAIAEFEKEHPEIDVTAVYGSSGNFFSQLANKAPFDVYFSADVDYPRKLVEAGLALEDSQFTYAMGRLVVWVPKDSPIDVEKLGIESLVHASVRKIAMANPQHAPYGRAAVAAMKKLGVYDRVKDRLALGENIAQAAQFVDTGAADIGAIALSLAMSPAMKERGKYWPVPVNAYPTLEQGGVILSWAKDVEAARQFQEFVAGPQGRIILNRYGFVLPGE
jgi:molybdate transport system substrate-binding protein